MSLINLEQISKWYGTGPERTDALRNVSLQVSPGEFVAFWGPSGSGKTTLLNIIGCLDQPSSGSMSLTGINPAKLSDRRLSLLRNKTIGFIFQDFQLLPVLSVLENVLLPLEFRGTPAREERALAEEYLRQVGLWEKRKQRADKLSGGEKQRVAVARALATRPKIILADEPTANLDTDNAMNIIELLLRLNREQGLTCLFSTHDVRLLAHVGRRIRLTDGRASTDAAPEERS